MGKFINQLSKFIGTLILVFGFLTICNWTFNPVEWNGLSRVILGVGMLASIKHHFVDNL